MTQEALEHEEVGPSEAGMPLLKPSQQPSRQGQSKTAKEAVHALVTYYTEDSRRHMCATW
jgi:hypothetical protein